MRIDSHHHIWDLSVREQGWMVGDEMKPVRRNFSMQDLREQSAGTGVEKTILVQTTATYDETPEFLAIANSDPMIAGVVGWLDMETLEAQDKLDAYLELPGGEKLISIRDLAQFKDDPRWLMRPNVVKNVRQLGARDIAYDLLTKPDQLQAAIELVQACPETQFVMDHISKPFIGKGEVEPWGKQMRDLASLPNVVCKVSGMVTEANWSNWKAGDFAPYIEILLECFGAERLMFGSDWPVALLAATYQEVVELAENLTRSLSASEENFFWSQTAIRAYGLAI